MLVICCSYFSCLYHCLLLFLEERIRHYNITLQLFACFLCKVCTFIFSINLFIYLVFNFPASSYVQGLEQNPTYTRNVIFRGEGFSSTLLSQKSCRAAISCWATGASFYTKCKLSKFVGPYACFFQNKPRGKCYILWFQLLVGSKVTFFFPSFYLLSQHISW